jgi:hypothetical protein
LICPVTFFICVSRQLAANGQKLGQAVFSTWL